MISKRGQVSEAMTWSVATVIIIVMAFIFLFLTGILSAKKNVGESNDYTVAVSNRGVQQMLFAILNAEVQGKEETIQSWMLREENPALIRNEVARVLLMLEDEGVKCDFSFLQNGKVKYGVERGATGKNEVFSYVAYGDEKREVRLRC